MLDMLEKLINEHGSSAILRERLELFSDKYSMLEEKNKHLTERNEELEAQLKSAKEEREKLKETLESNQAPHTEDGLEQVEVDILKFLFDTNQELFASHISQKFQIPIGNAEYHIDNLLKKELIYASYSGIEQTRFSINSDGRAYIVKNT